MKFFTLDAVAVLACLPHVSVKMNRKTMEALHLRADGVVEATDGHTFGAYRQGHTAGREITLALHDPKQIAALKKLATDAAKRDAPLTVQEVITAGEAVTYQISEDGRLADSRYLLASEFPFPSTAHVWPTIAGSSTATVALDPALVARFAVKVTPRREPRVRFTFWDATKPVVAEVASLPNFRGLIMPWRWNEMTDAVPAWVQKDTEEGRADA